MPPFCCGCLSELFEQLPEVGDLDQPKLVFFFDEAHLLFNEAPKVLIERIELVVRLVRSKGVGVYFVTQNPLDIPDSVLAQLSNRVQHALRAFTPRDQKAVAAAAQTMRPNPGLDIETAITELGVGEALVSFLDSKGRPCPTERAFVLLPGSQLGPITTTQRQDLLQSSLVAGIYEKVVDRESAYEKLQGRTTSALGNGAAARNGQGAPPGQRSRRQCPAPRRRWTDGWAERCAVWYHRSKGREARWIGPDHGPLRCPHHWHLGRQGNPARRTGWHFWQEIIGKRAFDEQPPPLPMCIWSTIHWCSTN
jgi:hypothetical protein